jgi:hypothetical protein
MVNGATPTVVPAGDLRTVALAGRPAGAGGVDGRIVSASLDDAGTVAMSVVDAGGGSAIVLQPPGEAPPEVVLKTGDPVPGGGRFGRFGEVDLGEDGFLLFEAELTGAAAAAGVFLRSPAGLRVVARGGDRSPRGHTLAGFQQLTMTAGRLGGEPWHHAAFVARLAGGRTSLLVAPSHADPAEMLVSGERAAGATVEEISISRTGFAVCAVASMRENGDRFRMALLASHGRVMWGERIREGREFPGLGRIAEIGAAPGLNVHLGLLAVTVAGGGCALVTRPFGVDPAVLARSGDPAPGMPGATLGKMGSPVANSGVPHPGPCGIASVVELSTGHTALWLCVLTQRLPPAGTAVMPLLAGEVTDDQHPSVVVSFRPVKLTNSGILLLRAVLDDGGRRRDALLLLDRLFDPYLPAPGRVRAG